MLPARDFKWLTLQERIKRTLAEGIRAGKTVEQLSEELNRLFDEEVSKMTRGAPGSETGM